MKKVITTALMAIMCCIGATARSSVSVKNANGVKIWYLFNDEDRTAEVSYEGEAMRLDKETRYTYKYNVVIPEKVVYGGKTYRVTSISPNAFYCCRYLTSVTIPESVTYIGDHAFYCCENLRSVTIPEGVTRICSYAFAVCTSLTSIEIPNSVTSIGKAAFIDCTNLTSIEIPNSVTSIETWVFASCKGLTSIVSNATTPPTIEDTYMVFNNVNREIPVYVPEGSVEAYKAAKGWNYFTNIQAKKSTGVEEITEDEADDVTVKEIYTTNGNKVDAMTEGVNIVVYSNGKVGKVMVR